MSPGQTWEGDHESWGNPGSSAVPPNNTFSFLGPEAPAVRAACWHQCWHTDTAFSTAIPTRVLCHQHNPAQDHDPSHETETPDHHQHQADFSTPGHKASNRANNGAGTGASTSASTGVGTTASTAGIR